MFAGIDIGGTSIKYGVTTKDGAILFQDSIQTEPEKGPDHMVARLQKLIHDISEAFPELMSFGIGFPSVVNPTDGWMHLLSSESSLMGHCPSCATIAISHNASCCYR